MVGNDFYMPKCKRDLSERKWIPYGTDLVDALVVLGTLLCVRSREGQLVPPKMTCEHSTITGQDTHSRHDYKWPCVG